jgi:NAD+ diphosphatase
VVDFAQFAGMSWSENLTVLPPWLRWIHVSLSIIRRRNSSRTKTELKPNYTQRLQQLERVWRVVNISAHVVVTSRVRCRQITQQFVLCYFLFLIKRWGSSMWPSSPDEFSANHVMAEGDDSGEAWYFAFMRDELICKSVQGIPEPITADDFRWFDVETRSKHFLGHYANRPCFALSVKGAVPEGFAKLGLRGLLGRTSQSLFYLAGRAKQVIDWHQTNQFCGRCGESMQVHGADRAMQCGACRFIAYPRLSPSIIVLITKGDEMLLARNAAWPQGMYSTLAGFVEAGESIEQTVHREVMEEVGLEVGELKYFGSQSWPFPNSLMLGFHAKYVGGDIVCQPGEIADAQWYTKDTLPQIPPKTAISGWLIQEFIDQLG